MVATPLPYNISQLQGLEVRLSQSEHSGGTCNCWGVQFIFVIARGFPGVVDLLSGGFECDVQSQADHSVCTYPLSFCGGSASVPRGVVYKANHNLTGMFESCETKVVETKPTSAECVPSSPAVLELNFEANLRSPCDSLDFFDEGIEISIGTTGNWTPLAFLTTSSCRSPDNHNIPQDRPEDGFATIRGYTVPLYIQEGPSPLQVSLCIDQFQDEAFEIRWLQTTSLRIQNSYQNRDVWTLSDLYITNNTTDQCRRIEVPVNSDKVRNGNFSSACSSDGEDRWVMGGNCTTDGCDSPGTQITASRILTSSTVNLTELFTGNQSEICPPSTTTPSITDDVIRAYEINAINDLTAIFNLLPGQIASDERLNAIMVQIETSPIAAVNELLDLLRSGATIDETAIVFILYHVLEERQDSTNPRLLSEGVLRVVDLLIEQTTLNPKPQPNTIAGSSLLSLVERLAFDVLSETQLTQIDNRNIVVRVLDVDPDLESFTGIAVDGHSLLVPGQLLSIVSNTTITTAAAHYRNMTGLLASALPGGEGTILASPVLSTSLRCGEQLCATSSPELDQPVVITLTHTEHIRETIEKDNQSQVTCVFWEFISTSENPLSSGRWSTEGCTRNANLSSTSQTVCECEHLTNFAILLSAQPLNTTGAVALSLAIIGYIGVSLSVAAMTVTIFTLLFLRSLWSMRNFIHINLCVSLILAQLTFVVGVTPHEGGGEVGPGCRTAAVLIHYLFLVSFMWMLMEGVVLYIALVKVFVKNQIRYMVGFFIFSYGAPLLYMALCVPLAFAHFPRPEWGYGYSQLLNGNDTIVCWLNPHNGFVWSFIVPVILTILVNVGFFIMALVIMCRHSKKQTHKSRLDSAKHWIKGSISLVTLMGIAWIIGVLVLEVPALIPLAYIFTIVVAFQGVAIFLIFVVFSKQVREAYKKWWRIKVAESDILSKHFGEFSVTSNTTLTRTGASSPGYVSTGNGAVHSQIDSAYETSHFETSLTEPEKENLAHRRSTFCRQGTSFDVTFVPAPSKEAMSVELGAEVTPYQSTPNGRHDDGEMAPDTQDNVVFSDPETDITVL